MLIGLRPVLRLELFDNRLDLFRFIARNDQHGVRCRHYDNVVETDDGGDDVVFRTRQAVAAVSKNYRADADVAFTVVRQHIPDRVPTADVRPAEIDGNDRGPRGTLHYRIVD